VNVNYLKIPKNHRGPHAARVFETPDVEALSVENVYVTSGLKTKKMIHGSLNAGSLEKSVYLANVRIHYSSTKMTS